MSRSETSPWQRLRPLALPLVATTPLVAVAFGLEAAGSTGRWYVLDAWRSPSYRASAGAFAALLGSAFLLLAARGATQRRPRVALMWVAGLVVSLVLAELAANALNASANLLGRSMSIIPSRAQVVADANLLDVLMLLPVNMLRYPVSGSVTALFQVGTGLLFVALIRFRGVRGGLQWVQLWFVLWLWLVVHRALVAVLAVWVSGGGEMPLRWFETMAFRGYSFVTPTLGRFVAAILTESFATAAGVGLVLATAPRARRVLAGADAPSLQAPAGTTTAPDGGGRDPG